VIGFLRLDSDKKDSFTQKDADRLTLISGSLALAIENIRILNMHLYFMMLEKSFFHLKF